MSWSAVSIRYVPSVNTDAAPSCHCEKCAGLLPAHYRAEMVHTGSGLVATRDWCMARTAKFAHQHGMQPFPFGPGITEARPVSTPTTTGSP